MLGMLMGWACEYGAVYFTATCEKCQVVSREFGSFTDMLNRLSEDGWHISPETFHCGQPQVFFCPECKPKVRH